MAADMSWKDRLDALEALPVLPSLAIRFIELGKDSDAEIQDYVDVAQGDPSLATKLLAVANSAWIGARHEIRTVKQAVGLLGTNNVRALAISYCLAGLHSVWKLDSADAEAFWEASLCKAAAAELLMGTIAPKRAEEAFTMALFQDIGVGLLAAEGGAEYIQGLQKPALKVSDQIAWETGQFGADHSGCGREIALRLKLPTMFVDAIGLHHDSQRLQAALNDPIVGALDAAALLPHDMRSWKQADVEQLDQVIHASFSKRWADVKMFIAELQAKLTSLMGLLNPANASPPSLEELIREACAENARCTATLVGQVHSLVTNNNNLAAAISALTGDHAASEMRANRDPLTGLLNREGFEKLAKHLLEKGERGPLSVAVAMFDLDLFKSVNDTHGHACGDMLLKTVATRLRNQARSLDLICRWGGDEIVAMFEGLDEQQAMQAVQRLQAAVTRDPVAWRDMTIPLRMSAGLRWVEHVDHRTSLTELIESADRAMYESKRNRGSQIVYVSPSGGELCTAGPPASHA